MTKAKLKALARKSIKEGVAEVQDANGNPYFAYVMPVRDGMRFFTVIMDEDIAELNKSRLVDILVSDAESILRSPVMTV